MASLPERPVQAKSCPGRGQGHQVKKGGESIRSGLRTVGLSPLSEAAASIAEPGRAGRHQHGTEVPAAPAPG